MSKDKNTKMDAVNNIVGIEVSIKEVVVAAVKYVALIVLVTFVAIALLFSLESLIAKAAVLIIAAFIINGLLAVVWLEGSASLFKKVQ